jgi:lysophospholipase L1-like esterase
MSIVTLRKFFFELVLFFSVLLLNLCIAEGVVRIFTKNHLIYDIEMTKYAKVLKADNTDTKIQFSHIPNINTKLMGVTVSINSDGFRDREYDLNEKKVKRIIFLGDSLTFGWGVEKEQTFEELLENYLNTFDKTQIINFAVGNYNTEQEVNLFIQNYQKYKPNAVVLFYFINDAEETQQRNIYRVFGESQLITLLWSRINQLKSANSGQDYKSYYKNLYEFENSTGWEIAIDNFRILKDFCIEKDISLKVILLPDFHNLQNYPFLDENEIIMNFLNSQNIEALDITQKFSGIVEANKLWVALDDAHPNALTHEMIYEFTKDFILK